MWRDFSDAFIYFPDDPFKLVSIWLFAVGQVRGGLRWSDGGSIRESWEIWPEEPDGRISRIAQTTQSSGRHRWNASSWWDRLLLEGWSCLVRGSEDGRQGEEFSIREEGGSRREEPLWLDRTSNTGVREDPFNLLDPTFGHCPNSNWTHHFFYWKEQAIQVLGKTHLIELLSFKAGNCYEIAKL